MSVHDEPIGRSVDETMRLLESAQFAAANKVKSVFQGLDPPFTHVQHIRQTVLRACANLEKRRCSAQSSVLFFRLSSDEFVSSIWGCFLILVKRFLPALRSRPCFPDYLVANHCFQTLNFGPLSGQGMPKPKPQTPNPKT